MTTRLDEIKARLDLAPNYKWTKVENNWSTTTIYSGDDTICTLQIDEDLDEDDEGIEEFMADQAAAAELIAHCPDDLRWLIAELERQTEYADSYQAAMNRSVELFQAAHAELERERADFAELMKRKERSKAMLEKCLWILSAVCDGIHDHPDIESKPVLDELQLFLHNHPEWVKQYELPSS